MLFRSDSESWLFPPTENEYRTAIKALYRYKGRLADPRQQDAQFFARADMLDTNVGQSKKDDPAWVARKGWDAMKAGEGHITTGLKNKLQVAGAGVVPQSVLAEAHRKIAEPGSANR